MKTTITTALILIIGLILGPIGDSALSQIQYVPDEGSKLWIEGSSNVNSFQCDASAFDGQAFIFSSLLYQVPGPPETYSAQNELSIRVDVNVDGFECGRSRMNRDLREALQADEFPKITFIFGSAETVEEYNNEENGNLEVSLDVNGSLTVAGTTRDINFRIEGTYMEDERIRAYGNKEILMSDFGVEAPTAMLGMVRARDELTVHFDLIAKIQTTD